MSKPTRSPQRRDALSPERIIEAAIEILDRDGEDALTFKALTARLDTGAGAIYHHIANKAKLLSAATDQVVARLLSDVSEEAEPTDALRAISLAIFDAIDDHPWVGAQLSRNPLPAVIRIWTAIGRQLQHLGVAEQHLSDAGSALVNYVLGSAAQFAAGARTAPDEKDRAAYLDALGEQLAQLDSGPLSTDTADQLHEHDDRTQFLTGIEILLTGITHLMTAPADAR